MKTKFYLGMAMLALLMANCAQEENVPALENDYSIISASIESAAKTRSVVTEGGEFSWTDGDKISVQKQNGKFATYIYGNDSRFALDSQETPATLSGVAYYPANENHTPTAFILPAEYNLEDNTKNTNAPMIASVEEGTTDFSFKHMGGVLRFIFRNVPAEANKFVFTTDKAIAGEFNVVTESDGTQVIKTVDASSSNNTITINFTKGQSADMTFYVPMPIGTYTGMSVTFYDGENKLWSTSTTADNTIGRASLLLMPTLTCTANASTASTSDAVSSALGRVTEDEPEASVNLTGDATNEDISIPESFTEAATEESNLNLTYNDVPTANEAITISDANPSAEQSDSKGNVNISIPNVADESKAPSFNINLPTMTVTLQANVENATYNEVTASTAKNTLRIAKGVTVKTLILNGGNIVIENGATVNAVVNKQGFEGKTYVVTLGTLTNNPNLDNVTVVDSEDDIPSYELRVLTFEDKDARFESYTLDYVDSWSGRDITTWSDLIDDPQYGGPLTYADYMSAAYTWYDEGNTELTHTFPDNYAYCFWGGGHAISNYWGEGWSDEDRDIHIAKYYGEDYITENAGNDAMLGWFNLQMMTPVKAHSGDNFAVHYGYKDFFSYVDNLPEISFGDDVARVIDHMYVCNTNYTLNQLYNGVKSEAGNSFGGNWEGLTESAWLKIVAQGFDDVDADAYAEPISEVEFYLVQGENVVTDWQKWDLSELGAVKKVRFNFQYSEEMGGKYGFTIPGYFAYDDVAVRFEK